MQGVTAISRKISCSWAPRLQNLRNRWAIYTTAIYRAYTVEGKQPGKQNVRRQIKDRNRWFSCTLFSPARPKEVLRKEKRCFADVGHNSQHEICTTCSALHQIGKGGIIHISLVVVLKKYEGPSHMVEGSKHLRNRSPTPHTGDTDDVGCTFL